MAAKELTRDQLLMKLGRTQLKLEQSRAKHKDTCGLDPDAPCSCGANTINAKIDAALAELKLE